MTRIARIALALLATVAFGQIARAQHSPPPLHLVSIESLVGNADVIVRGRVVDVSHDNAWNIVTLDVTETLKGDKAERLKVATHKFEAGDAMLAKAQKSKAEQVWILRSQKTGTPGEAPDREKMMARNKLDLHAPLLPGRPGSPALPAITLAKDAELPAFLTVDLRTLKTADDLTTAIRTAIKAPRPGQSYDIALPAEIAERSGFRGHTNVMTVPLDGRFEVTARRLVQSPGEFLSKDSPELRTMLRLEGVKALRFFRTEKNMALVRAWLDNPASSDSLQESKSVVPARPGAEAKVALPQQLAQVPEIHFQQPLTKAMKTEDAQLHTAVTIDAVHLLNQKKTDGYILELMRKRPDLGGLAFAMGDACRMKPEASTNFVAALDIFRQAEANSTPSPAGASNVGGVPRVMDQYQKLQKDKKIDPTASVATLMQVLGHEDGKTRLDLAHYLETLPNADATRALARFAIFSPEADIRAAAVNALKKRDQKVYTEILLSGLSYPWTSVAEHASDALVKLGRKDLVPQLINVLDQPDPRAPQKRKVEGKEVTVVRELVRVNHHHNCLLCHAPATTTRDKISPEE
ncbi:MAG TPA: hypothetical protein VFE62_05225, partial [Gemmataceae bacterium]|nr:hypothetical protein [Gemmataceae bacterium]